MLPHDSTAIMQSDYRVPLFEIGDRVRLRLHPKWMGTVVARSLSTNVSVKWDNHGVETTHGVLLELADANPASAKESTKAHSTGAEI